MDREFLEQLQVDAAVAEAILAQHQQELTQAQQEQEARLQQLEFDRVVEQAVTAAKGRSLPAIRALLDLQALQGRQDREKAVRAAVAQVKKDCGYLFESDRVAPRFAPGTGTQAAQPVVQETLAGALREKYRL